MIHGRRALLGGAVVTTLLGATTTRAEEQCDAAHTAPLPRANIVVWLKPMEAELKACQAANVYPEKASTLYGMTRVTGYVIDTVRNDIGLLGTSEPAAAPLRVQHLAVALRNADYKYAERKGNGNTIIYADPGVSIDPDPAVLHRLDEIVAAPVHTPAARDRQMAVWCTTCELPQTVRVMGVPFDCHFSNVMFIADHLLKRVSDGSASVDGLDSLSALNLRQAIARATRRVTRDSPDRQLEQVLVYAGRDRLPAG